MKPILDFIFQLGDAERSRFVVHPDDLQEVAEGIFKAAAMITAAETCTEPDDLPLYEHLSSIARAKGFQHCGTILSLVEQPGQTDRVDALIRDAIAAMGGPSDFFDTLDLITFPDGRAQ
jgi:hypothetical protein